MMRVFKAHILFTKERDRFEVLENGYVGVDDEGLVTGVAGSLEGLLAAAGDPAGKPPGAERGAERGAATGAAATGGAAAGGWDGRVTDFGDRLLIPAMVDMHVHAAQVRNQGVAMDLELLPWLRQYTFPEEARYADVGYAERMYRRFLHTQWLFGTMRSVVFGTVHTEATRRLMGLYREAGMGALVGKVAMDRNCPAELCEDASRYVAGFEELMGECGAVDGGGEMGTMGTMGSMGAGGAVDGLAPLVRPIVTPRFVPSCTPGLLEACGGLARRYGLPVQSHLSENVSEIEWVRELEPESGSYGEAYDRYGLFGQTPTVMAHCVWTRGRELELMRRRGVMVAHCPTSNFNLSSGMAPVRALLEAGVGVGLGSDISGGHDLNMFRMLVYAIQVSKMHYQMDRSKAPLTLSEAFWLATKSAGRFFGRVGSFEPGYEFDALVIDDSVLHASEYSLLHRLERFVYVGDDRQILFRFCRGREVPEPRE